MKAWIRKCPDTRLYFVHVVCGSPSCVPMQCSWWGL